MDPHSWTHLSFGWLVALCFGLTVLSAIVPWVTAEVFVLALPAVTSSRTALLCLVVVATAGQMSGKCLVYWASRRGSARTSPRMRERLDHWRTRLERARTGPIGVVFLSAFLGFPPFFVITALAGALAIDFPRFMAAGSIGRFIRFGALVFVPQLVALCCR